MEQFAKTLFVIITFLTFALTASCMVAAFLFSDHGGDPRLKALRNSYTLLAIYFAISFATALIFPGVERIEYRWLAAIFSMTMLLIGIGWLIWTFSKKR